MNGPQGQPATQCWYAVDLEIAPRAEEIITWNMWELGAAGIQTLAETRNQIVISATFETIPDLQQIKSALYAALDDVSFEQTDLGQITLREVVNEDWLKKWKEGYEPFPVGNRFLITPSWIKPDAELIQDRIVIEIDPGMAFGTGTHETTQLCLQAIEEYWQGGRLLDVGTGTGILAIGASKLYPDAEIYAFDVDANAITIARENARINNISKNLHFEVGDISRYDGQQFSVVVANLTIDILGPEISRLANVVDHGGSLIMSGILTQQVSDLRLLIEHAALVEISCETLGEWAMMAAKRP
jgi:ribosomal protein L11 methyltransferase